MQEGEITLKKEKTTPAAQPTEKLEAPVTLDARAQPKLSGGSARMRDPQLQQRRGSFNVQDNEDDFMRQ